MNFSRLLKNELIKLQVSYQDGELDQYYHRYYYDADNRITSVFTSTDNRHWDNDAKYFYYKHGPLSRKEIGNQKSQGEDYAYTIQGWIKGTNSNSLYASRDMGLDGKDDVLNANRFFGNDVAAYSLHYFSGDYVAKAKSNAGYSAGDFFLMQTSAATYLSSDAPDLYNGNIRSMVTSVRNDNVSGNTPVALLTAYRYDQLNRIKQMKMYRDADLVNNAWGNGSSYANAFEEHYVYDFNGNILQQVRNGNSTTVSMDNLRYYYYKQDGSIFDPLSTVTPSNATNKLAYVTDAVSSGNYSNDIDNQSSGNYTYDAIGQLISDSQEEIASIEWTVTGKVKQVLRSSGSSKKDLEFVYDPMGHRIAKIVKPQGSSTPSQWKYTYYILDASGNQMATYTKNETDYLYLQDQTIFGSAREGLINRNIAMDTSVLATTVKSNRIGDKQYQMSNHLGNVLSTFSDALVSDNGGSGSTIVAYYPVILSASSYSSFGAPLEDPTTNWENVGYRYAFNGMEKDDEMKGAGNSYDFGARIYDARLGRWMSCDPHELRYPGINPYNFSFNNPLIFNDLDGKDGRLTIDYEKKTVTIQTTVHLYGAKSTIEGEAIAADFNKQFMGIKTSQNVLDPNDPNVTWTIKIDVQFVYNDCIDSYNEALGIDPKSTQMVGTEFETYASANLGLEAGDNIYNLNIPSNEALGHANPGGNEARGMDNFSTIMHELLHMLGYDERYLAPYGAVIDYYKTDFLTSSDGSPTEIHPIHFIDLLDYTLENYKKSGTNIVGNTDAKSEEVIIPGENGQPETRKEVIKEGKQLKIDNTSRGKKMDIAGDKEKVKSRTSF